MLRFTSYTDEFYIQEIHNGNKKVIDHFYAFCRDYSCKTYKKLFQEEESGGRFFFREDFMKLWKEICRCSIFVKDNQIYKVS